MNKIARPLPARVSVYTTPALRSEGALFARKLEKLAAGIQYQSEGDAPYAMVYLPSAPKVLDVAYIKAAMRDALAKALKGDERGVTLPALRLSVDPADKFFLDESVDPNGSHDPAQREALRKIHTLIQANLVPISGRGSDGKTRVAKLFSITGDDSQMVSGPMYFVGRHKDGSLVGLVTQRFWT
jgi:hypothetical protein